MVKKIIKFILCLFLIFLLLFFLIKILKKDHKVFYEIKNEQKIFDVKEQLIDNNYYIKISNKGHEFSFKVFNNYSKKKRIVKKIEFFEKDNILCIYPVLEKDNLNIFCSDKDFVYVDNNNDFITKLEKKGYKLLFNNNFSSNIEKVENTFIYKDNLLSNTYIYVWKYNGFYAISSKKIEQINIFEKDTYVNDLGILVDNYYIIPNYDQKLEFDTIFIFNLKNNRKKTMKLKHKISKDSYINGVVDNKVYIFDKDNLFQYEINPKKGKIREVGNKKDECLYYDGTWHKISAYDLRDEDIIFVSNYDYLNDIVDVTSLKYLSKNDYLYYYLDFDDNFYVYDSINDVKTLLFKEEGLTYITNVFDDIYFVKENMLYRYTINGGIKSIFKYDELVFNYKNRVAIYKG